MLSYQFYKVLHLSGIFMVLISLGGCTMHVINGGAKAHYFRKPMAITHGLGLLLSLIGGFGLLARLGFAHNVLPPGWALAKFGIWLVFGGLTQIIFKKPRTAPFLWVLIMLLATTAAFLANYKPI